MSDDILVEDYDSDVVDTLSTKDTSTKNDPIDDITKLLMDEEQEAVDGETQGTDKQDAKKEPKDKANEEDVVTWGKTLGIDDDDIVLDEDGNFKAVKIKVNGETSEVDLKTLKDGFQFAKYTTQKSQALAEEKKAFEQARVEAAELYQAKLAESQQITSYLNDQLMAEFNGIDWQQLRMLDPQEYSARYTDLTARQQQIAQLYTGIQEEVAQFKAKQAQWQDAEKKRIVSENIDILTQKHPEWVNRDRMKQDFSTYRSFVTEAYGISGQEFDALLDWKAIEVIRDAYNYRKSKKEADTKLKANVPKFVKSSGAQKPKSKLDILTKAAKTATGNNKRAYQDAVIIELLKSG